MFESIKAIEFKASMLFNLDFVDNSILLCFLFFFLFFDLNFLIPATIAQIFNPTAELAIPTGISSKKAKAKTEANAVNAKAKI